MIMSTPLVNAPRDKRSNNVVIWIQIYRGKEKGVNGLLSMTESLEQIGSGF